MPLEEHVWVFGFGSLVHTPGFEWDERVEGYICGWRRVWWQGSTDHRGTPERPGRTVTLTADPDAKTWGAAYRLAGPPDRQRATLAYLEWREKQYDLRQAVDVYASLDAAAPAVRGALCYIATACSVANPNFLGPAPLRDIALQIASARGPSGENWEYVARLAGAMRGMGVEDEELFQLERMVDARRAELAAAAGATYDAASVDGARAGSLQDAPASNGQPDVALSSATVAAFAEAAAYAER